MEKFLEIVQSINYPFAFIILIGGRYWGGTFFSLFKNAAWNFLAFASVFALIWLVIEYFVGNLSWAVAGSLLITYVFTTSFYELLAKRIFEIVENFIGKKKTGKDE